MHGHVYTRRAPHASRVEAATCTELLIIIIHLGQIRVQVSIDGERKTDRTAQVARNVRTDASVHTAELHVFL